MQMLRLAGLAASFLLGLGACGSSDSSPIEPAQATTTSATVSTTASTVTGTSSTSTPRATTATTATTIGEPAVASATAESYKIVAPTVDELGQGVYDFVAATDAARIDVLADQACGVASASLGESELGLQSLASYDRLSPTEQEMITVEDWVVFYGSILGYFCPENLGQTVKDKAPAPSGDAAEQFRATIATLDGVSPEAVQFVTSLDETDFAELQTAACNPDQVAPESDTFGLAISASYDTDLTATQRDELSATAYSELYGAIVGWFCPSNLPR